MSCAIETNAGDSGFQAVSQLRLLHQFQVQEKQQQQQQSRQTSEQPTCSQAATFQPTTTATTTICDNQDDRLLISDTQPKCSTFRPAADQRTLDSTPSAAKSCILLRKQRQQKQKQQQQQQQCQATTRNSLESLHSRASSSDAGSPEVAPAAATVLAATRYVEPASVDRFKLLDSMGAQPKGALEQQVDAFGRATPAATTPHPMSPAHHRHPDHDEFTEPNKWQPGGRKSLGAGSSGSGSGEGGEGRQHRPAQQAQRAQQIGKKEAPFMFAGILGSILGSLFFSTGILCIKLLPDGHGLADKTQFVFFRGVVMLILCTISLCLQKTTFLVRRDEILINALRSIFGFAGVFGVYISLKYISMGDSTALVFSSPVWTSLLSHFILHEPLQWVQLMALPASLVGIIFIAHPALLINMEHAAGYSERQPTLDLADSLANEQLPLAEMLVNPLQELRNGTEVDTAALFQAANQTAQYLANHTSALLQTLNSDVDISTNTSEHFDYEHRWKGIVIALGTSFIVSLVYIVLKFRKTTPIQTTTFWLSVTTVCFSLILMAFVGFGEWPSSGWQWALIVCNGCCSWLGQILLQWAMSYEDASVLSVIRTLDVAMTFSLSALFLDEEILWTSILGASIIAAVVVSIMLNSWLTKKLCPPPPGDPLQPSATHSDQHIATLKSLEAGNGVAVSRHSSVVVA